MMAAAASPLHAARAAAGCAYCAALALVALAGDHPLVLAGAFAATVAAGLATGSGRALARAARLALPLALLIALINPLVAHEGLTIVARLGTVPVLGRLDVTAEAIAYGAVLGLRVAIVILCCALYAAAIDPDEVLRLFRRFSFRSALTATLATRMVPVLRRDGERLAEAQRCRPDGGASRLALMRAVTAGSLDRAVDVAAALELRGYGSARRPPRARRPLSRHDIAVGLAAAGLLALAVLGALADFDAYPRLSLELDPFVYALAAAIPACALAPLLERRGVLR